MNDRLYIDPVERKRIATRWVVITLTALHFWATIIIIAVIAAAGNSDALGAMFSTCTFGIGATLGILLLDRAADTILARFALPSPPPAEVKETVTRTVTTSPPTDGATSNDNS